MPSVMQHTPRYCLCGNRLADDTPASVWSCSDACAEKRRLAKQRACTHNGLFRVVQDVGGFAVACSACDYVRAFDPSDPADVAELHGWFVAQLRRAASLHAPSVHQCRCNDCGEMEARFVELLALCRQAAGAEVAGA
jgi:hypothetical protein